MALTPEQIQELVKECGLDWKRGYMPLFDGDPTNRYAVLVEAVEAPLLARIAELEAQVEQAAQPVGWQKAILRSEEDGMVIIGWDYCTEAEFGHLRIPKRKLYTAPPKAPPLTDEQCDAIASSLDDWACEVDHYEFGLPIHVNAEANTWRAIIRAATVEKG